MSGWNFKQWYGENKERFNEDRRMRYQTDPDYRARVLEANRQHRAKRQADKLSEEKKKKKAQQIVPKKAYREVTLKGPNGEEVKCLTIGALARALGRTTQSIRLWEKNGVIPPTPHRNSRGDRLYTPEQVVAIREKLKDAKDFDKAPEPPEFFAETGVVTVGGKEKTLTLFRVGMLAQAVGRTVLTLEQMERRGVFPKTPLREPATGRRYYTAEMIEAVKDAFDDAQGVRLRGAEKQKKFYDLVLATWTALGLHDANLVKIEGKVTYG